MPEIFQNFTGIFGVIILLLIAFLLSSNRRGINLRIVLSALGLQTALAFIFLKFDGGIAAIISLSNAVDSLLDYGRSGVEFLFGDLADSEKMGQIFAVQVLPVVIFFSALMAILYHYRIMPVLVAVIGGGLQAIIGTRPVESLNAAANIFVGQTEAPLAIKPFLDKVTGPQLFALMVSGLASIAGTVLAAYAGIGIELEYLLVASLLAAPGGLLMAKIMVPDETQDEDDALAIRSILEEKSPHTNGFMAAAAGASDGMKLAFNIGAMLIAFFSLITLANGMIGWIGGFTPVDDLSLQKMLGWLFSPLMFVVGIPWSEAQAAGALFGEKIILTEFVAYFNLIAASEGLSPRTVTIMTFALCGFANLLSIGILLGGLGALVPDRMGEIATYGMRALIAASLSNLMSATLAGLMVG